MRPLEVLVALANLLAFLALLIPRRSALRWTGVLILAALVTAAMQALAEGYRWQLVPASALTAAFGLVWLWRRRSHMAIDPRLLLFIAAGLGGLGVVFSTLLPVLVPVFHFPNPTGPYAIGTMTYHWVDVSRPELFTADPRDHRELMAQVWYPARAGTTGQRSPYIQHANTWAADMAHIFSLPGYVFTHFRYVTTNAVVAAPIASDPPTFPVLVYQTGLGGFRSVSTFQVEALVSHGYVVVGLDQPGAAASVTFPDGHHIAGWTKSRMAPLIDQAVWPQTRAPVLGGVPLPGGITPFFGQDASFALDQLTALNRADPAGLLTHHLDLGHAGTFGISLGGMGVAEACANDRRFKACLIMDVFLPQRIVRTRLTQPTMFITRDAASMRLERRRSGGWTERDIASTLETMRAVYRRLSGDGYYVEIPGMFHINFTDVPDWVLPARQIGLTGPIRAQSGFDIVNAYSLAFFDRHLKNRPAALLEGSGSAAGATLETRQGHLDQVVPTLERTGRNP